METEEETPKEEHRGIVAKRALPGIGSGKLRDIARLGMNV